MATGTGLLVKSSHRYRCNYNSISIPTSHSL